MRSSPQESQRNGGGDFGVKAAIEELEKMDSEHMRQADYFRLRNVDAAMYEGLSVPPYFFPVIAQLTPESRILDIGCGLGQLINAIREKGYRNVYGIDVSEEAVSSCVRKGLSVTGISDITDYARDNQEGYDLIIMSHVVEHIEKSKIIATLAAVRGMLRPTGNLVVMVPNAQSNTGCYWAYEDFTHTTLFTAGSLIYVLRAAGYSEIRFLDPDGLEGMSGIKRVIKKVLLRAYIANKNFWNKVTTSSYHRPSPAIFTYEIKCVASK